MTVIDSTPGTVPAAVRRQARQPAERKGWELRGAAAQPSEVEVKLFIDDIAEIARRLLAAGQK